MKPAVLSYPANCRNFLLIRHTVHLFFVLLIFWSIGINRAQDEDGLYSKYIPGGFDEVEYFAAVDTKQEIKQFFGNYKGRAPFKLSRPVYKVFDEILFSDATDNLENPVIRTFDDDPISNSLFFDYKLITGCNRKICDRWAALLVDDEYSINFAALVVNECFLHHKKAVIPLNIQLLSSA